MNVGVDVDVDVDVIIYLVLRAACLRVSVRLSPHLLLASCPRALQEKMKVVVSSSAVTGKMWV